jgi:RNA polymerase sigma factor (sigma-70 family)
MVASVDGWIHRIAFRHQRTYQLAEHEVADLIAEGQIGALIAARMFDPERGVKYLTYAALRISQAMRLYIRERTVTIRAPQPRNREQRMSQIQMRHALATIPLDGPARRSGDPALSLAEIVPCPNPTPEDDAIEDDKRRMSEALGEAIRTLSPRSQRILQARLRGDTLSTIGARMRLTRERVRQLEAAAVKLLRTRLKETT